MNYATTLKTASPRLAETPPPGLTAEEYVALQIEDRTELVDGKIITMGKSNPKHAIVEINIGYALKHFIKPRKLGRLYSGDVAIRTGPRTIRAADIAFLSKDRVEEAGDRATLLVTPDIVIEVVSESNTWRDTLQKIREYFRGGAQQVWIADPETKDIQVFTSPDAFRRLSVEAGDILDGGGALPGFSVPVDELFALD